MHNRFQAAIERLERQKTKVLSDAIQFSEQRLRYRPNASTWSALDILDHVVKVENASFDVVRRNLPHGHPIGLKDRVGAFMVTTVMKTTIRVKVPAGANMVLPAEVADLSEISSRWNKTRDAMRALTEELADAQFRVGLFRHPVAGWMNISQTLGFLSAHLQHHVFQIHRLKMLTDRLS